VIFGPTLRFVEHRHLSRVAWLRSPFLQVHSGDIWLVVFGFSTEVSDTLKALSGGLLSFTAGTIRGIAEKACWYSQKVRGQIYLVAFL